MSQNRSVGGYTLAPMQACSLPQKVATGFTQVAASMVGAKYLPVLYVGEQIVHGINHMLICKQTLLDRDATEHLVEVVLNQNLDDGSLVGEWSVVSITRLDTTQIQETPNCTHPFGLEYCVHVKDKGWLPAVREGQIAGTTGEHRRLEAVKIVLTDCEIPDACVKYRVHVKDTGWLDYVSDGAVAGTTGEHRRAEAIQIHLDGLPEYSIVYRVHMKDTGWGPWARDGQVAGTIEEHRRIEAIQAFVARR